ncbi:MAG: hypothetical protein SFV23_01325 [Planctomycetaceae bacterium]|nr:hypothetical protein [Planctomycetaceae bacterium]
MERSRYWIVMSVRFGRTGRVRVTDRMLAVPLAGIALLASYVLTTGPLVWALDTCGLDRYPFLVSVAEVAYFPIIWFQEHCDTFDDWLQWYMAFWQP